MGAVGPDTFGEIALVDFIDYGFGEKSDNGVHYRGRDQPKKENQYKCNYQPKEKTQLIQRLRLLLFFSPRSPR
jgi:hypothetical protein